MTGNVIDNFIWVMRDTFTRNLTYQTYSGFFGVFEELYRCLIKINYTRD